jgi:hypothetical protein
VPAIEGPKEIAEEVAMLYLNALLRPLPAHRLVWPEESSGGYGLCIHEWNQVHYHLRLVNGSAKTSRIMFNVSYMTLSHGLDGSAIGLLRSICLISVPLPPGQVAPLFDMKNITDSKP